MSHITLRDIAEELDISRMTVSLALRNSPKVAEATRVHVEQTAKRMGYQPNAKLSRMMSEMAQSNHQSARLGEFAFLTSLSTEYGWKKYHHFCECFEGAKAHAQDFGYSVTPFWTLNSQYKGGRLSDVLWARGIEGVILSPLGERIFEGHDPSFSFDWERFCLVQIGATLTEPSLNLVRHDHFQGMISALTNMEQCGYRRIGFAISKTDERRSNHRWAAAYFQWRTLRGMSDNLPILMYETLPPAGEFEAWIKQYQIEAIVSINEVPYDLLVKNKWSIPEELGFAVLDHNPDNESLSGIQQNARHIGAEAIDNLVLAVHKSTTGIPDHPKQVLVSGSWREGKTTRKIKSASKETFIPFYRDSLKNSS